MNFDLITGAYTGTMASDVENCATCRDEQGDPEVCACGEPSAITTTTEGWCNECLPLDVARELADERAYETWCDR